MRSISPHIVGRTIEHAQFFSPRVTRGGLDTTAKALRHKAIQGVRRRGKQILIDLDRGVLYVHLGMTGKLLWNGNAGKYTRALFVLDNGTLLYDDVRQFGRVEFFKIGSQILERSGPDALSVTFDKFYARLKRHGGALKPLLLNQAFIAGIGNIYADELLFAAGIHPRASAKRISRARAKKMHEHLNEVLQLAIRHRGSSISDYVDADGEEGFFQLQHRVYGREGERCLACKTPVKRVVIAGRSSHYCPNCQK